MMTGGYPCCDGPLLIPMPDQTPAFRPETCPHCGAKVWHHLSRVDPWSMTEADFLTKYEVNETAKSIKAKP